MIKHITIYTSFLFIAVGCGTVQKKPEPLVFRYSHPDHGVVVIPYEPLKNDRSECTEAVYSNGVKIDGVVTTDRETIDEYTVDYIMFSMRASELELRKTLADIGGTPLEKQKLNYDPTKTEAYYDEVKRVEEDINNCMTEKGWVKVE